MCVDVYSITMIHSVDGLATGADGEQRRVSIYTCYIYIRIYVYIIIYVYVYVNIHIYMCLCMTIDMDM